MKFRSVLAIVWSAQCVQKSCPARGRAILFMNVCVLFASLVGTPARASLIDAMDASAMIQSTSTDTDFGLLTAFFGFSGGETVNYGPLQL